MNFYPQILITLILTIFLNCEKSNSDKQIKNGCFEFYTYANDGYCSYLKKDYRSSIENYKKAFQLRIQGCNVSDYRNDHYLYAKALVHLGFYEEGQKFLRYSVLYGGIKWDDIIHDSLLSSQNSNGQLISKTEFDSLKEKRKSQLNTKLRKVIDSMVLKDQNYRLMVKEIPESKVDSIKNLQLIADKENEARLRSIIKNYGYPGYSKIGTDKLDLLLMHTTPDYRQELIPKLMKGVDSGSVNPDIIGMMIDQYLVLNKGGSQKYGYFFQNNEVYEKYFMPFKISDLDSINKYRKEIGAISLECSAVKNNAKLPYMFGFKYSPEK
jgi:tetratricopeptide (TPR) repeat protein